MSEIKYKVIAAACVVRDAAGAQTHLYFGAPVPDSVPALDLERLLEVGLIGPVADPIEVVVPGSDAPVQLIATSGNFPVEFTGTVGTVPAADEPAFAPVAGESPLGDALTVPHGNASEPTWRQYAIASGVPADQAETMDKKALQAAVAAL